MERARGPRAEAHAPGEEEEVGTAMAAVVAAAGGAGPAVLQVAGLYRGLCAVRSRALGLGLVSAAQLRVFPVRRSSGRPAGGADGSAVGDELEANPMATERVVQDLNDDPHLPFPDDSFDAVLCCVSIDYLTRPIEVLAEVRTGDVVLVPHGWHGPSMAAPGYDLYYLNVMAGPGEQRAWLICDDPAHGWVRGTWDGLEVDPRLPMGKDPR